MMSIAKPLKLPCKQNLLERGNFEESEEGSIQDEVLLTDMENLK